MLLETRLLGAKQILVQLLTVLLKIENCFVYLHGNHIATYNYANRELALYDGGWQSNTTKSRLNALCNELATGFGVFQKNWNWFVSDFNNKNVIDFFDGVTVYSDGVFIK